MSLSFSVVPVVVVFVLLALFFQKLSEFLTGPLKHVPGPWISRCSNLILKYNVLRGRRLHYFHALHEQYGPIVRISPSEIAVADPESAKEIHAISSGFHKSPWYQKLADGGQMVAFNILDPKQYAARRRLLANEMSETSLRRHEKFVSSKVRLAVAKMAQEATALKYMDVFKWWIYMATDVIGELSFGESFRMLDNGQQNDYSRLLKKNNSFSGIRAELKTIVKTVALLPIPAIREVATAGKRMDDYGRQSLNRYKALSANSDSRIPTLFSKLFVTHEDGGLTDEEVVGEARSYIIAGSDTTASTLTYLVWAVARHPKVQAALVAEVNQLGKDFTYEDLKGLPYMDQVITEALRLYPAAAGSLPRTVPHRGRKLAGYYIPEGLTASTQAYTLHRNRQVFAQPEEFNPSRWENPTKEMKTVMMPFGGASRSCIGIHLAQMELKMAVAVFYRSFPNARISTQQNMSDSDMEIENYFLIAPKAHRCLVEVLSSEKF